MSVGFGIDSRKFVYRREGISQAQMIIEFDGIMVVLVRPNFSVSE